ncbi:MAG TPA: hypothetical protein DCL41_02055 [Bdellovibrionales bacterium]|nr:hypothetical protein [Pseudobdellovibrionaceae bacterium]HAG90623.1 hypothetical protein [Bdellovibrionales bacterium]|tara:strand:+ start:372 stop:935 length:564 start_codon:yes stop_codon:yes gene_type:complete
MKTWLKYTAFIALAVGLSACSKNSSDNKQPVATTPTSTTTVPEVSCLSGQYVYNYQTGQYVDKDTGAVVNCTQTTGTLPTFGMNNGQYYNGCQQWNQMYASQGVQYYPVQMGGQMACIRSDLMGQYIPGFNQNMGYYGQQNFVTCSWGYDPYCNPYSNGYNGTGGCVQFGGSTWGQFSAQGQVGLCW